LEEGKVATWLNHITTALHSLAPSFRGMNTRSCTRTLADTQRLWSAEFATKPAPADVKMKMKSDIALLWKDPFDPNGPNSWRNVVSFIELCSTQEFSGIAKQAARTSYAIFVAQPVVILLSHCPSSNYISAFTSSIARVLFNLVCTVDFLIMHTVKLYISHIVLELVAPTVGQFV
jgi:hypothetical protein